MPSYKIGFNNNTLDVYIIESGNIPTGLINLGTYNVPLITDIPTPNHAIYHKIRDALYARGFKDMRLITIHSPQTGTPETPAMTFTVNEPSAAWTGREYRWPLTIDNIEGELTYSRVGGSQEVEILFDKVNKRMYIPQDKLVDGMMINTGTINIGDDRAPNFIIIKPRGILVSSIDYQPNFEGGARVKAKDPFDNSNILYARQSGTLPGFAVGGPIAPTSLMTSPDGLMDRLALTIFGETGLGTGDVNQRSEMSSNVTFAFNSEVYYFVPKIRLRNLAPLNALPYWRIPLQFHNAGANFSPQLAFEVRKDTVEVIGRAGAATPSANPPELLLGSFDRSLLDDDKFHNILIRYKSSSTGDGIVEIWVGKYMSLDPMQKVVSVVSNGADVKLNIGYDTRAMYPKHGLYFGHNKLAGSNIAAMSTEISRNIQISNRMSMLDYVNNPLLEDNTWLKPKASNPEVLVITGTFAPGQQISAVLPTFPGADKIPYSLRSSATEGAIGSAVPLSAVANAQGNANPGETLIFIVPEGYANRYFNIACRGVRNFGLENEANGPSVQSAGFGPVVDDTAITPLTMPYVTFLGDGDGSVGRRWTATPGTWPNGTPARTYQWERITTDSSLTVTPIPGATGLTYIAQEADIGCKLRFTETANSKSKARASHPRRVYRAPLIVHRGGDASGFTKGSGTFDLALENEANGFTGYEKPLTPEGAGLAIKSLASGTFYADKPVVSAPGTDFFPLVAGIDSQSYSANAIGVTIRRGTTTIAGFNALQNLGQKGRRIWTTGINNGSDFTAPAADAPSVLRLAHTSKGPANTRTRVDFVAGRAESTMTLGFDFDDGHSGPVRLILPELDSRNAKATFYPPANNIKATIDSSGYAAREEWISVLRRGHLLGINTRNDGSFLGFGDRTIQSAIDELNASRAALDTIFQGDPTWTAADQALLDRGKAFVCYSFGNYTNPLQDASAPIYNKSSYVTAIVEAADPRLMRWTATPAIKPTVGASLYGQYNQAGDFRAKKFTPNGLAKDGLPIATVVSVSADGLQVVMDRDIDLTSGKSTVFINDHTPFFEDNLMRAFRENGVKMARAVTNFDWSHMNTRFGFGDWDMAHTAQGFSGKRLADMQAWADKARRYKCYHGGYFHNALADSVATQGVHVYASDLISLIQGLDAEIAAGTCEIINKYTHWERDYGATIPPL